MSQDDSRSEANLRQFKSRSQQPKLLAGGQTAATPTPANVFIVFDQGFGSATDQIDDMRFNHVGTNPQLSQYEKINARRVRQAVMKEGFNW